MIGANVQCLEIWRHTNSEPHIHTVNFVFALGFAISPAIATQFLSTSKDEDDLGWELISGKL